MAGIWSGYLTFGLVTLPVRLYAGARGKRIGFHLLHAADHVRLKQQMICPREEAPVPRKDTVRGYEYAKGEYVIVSDEQIKAAAPPSERQLEIVEFCRAAEIDPIWFESSYYLMPETAGRRPYALLLQALQDSGYVAVARLSMHQREYLSLVRPSHLAGVPGFNSKHAGLVLETMYYHDEVRVADGFGEVGVDHDAKISDAELKMAHQLIEALAKPFDATRFEDRYRKNLEELVARALEGKPAPEHEKPRKLAPVVDLMQSLKASLENAGGAAPRGSQPASRGSQPAARGPQPAARGPQPAAKRKPPARVRTASGARKPRPAA